MNFISDCNIWITTKTARNQITFDCETKRQLLSFVLKTIHFSMTEVQQVSGTCEKRYEFFFGIIVLSLRNENQTKWIWKKTTGTSFHNRILALWKRSPGNFLYSRLSTVRIKPRNSGLRGGVAFYATCDVGFEIL